MKGTGMNKKHAMRKTAPHITPRPSGLGEWQWVWSQGTSGAWSGRACQLHQGNTEQRTA